MEQGETIEVFAFGYKSVCRGIIILKQQPNGVGPYEYIVQTKEKYHDKNKSFFIHKQFNSVTYSNHITRIVLIEKTLKVFR